MRFLHSAFLRGPTLGHDNGIVVVLHLGNHILENVLMVSRRLVSQLSLYDSPIMIDCTAVQPVPLFDSIYFDNCSSIIKLVDKTS